MPTEVSPKTVQRAVHRGRDRFRNFRSARLMFLRQFVGPYYDKSAGQVGNEALNLIFNAIRTLVPNIVMNFPKHSVESTFAVYRDYAEILGLALSWHDRQIRIRDTYRRAIVDAIFTLGILKTGLASSDSVYAFDEDDHIDNGMVYTECVDFDNFIVSPNSQEHLFKDASFMGDIITVPRQKLLDSGLYKNDLIERLPAVGSENPDPVASDLSRSQARRSEDYLQDEVEIAELWVPAAKAIITVPASKDLIFDDYLRVSEAYCPDTGPYTFLALTPPVPGNPIPVPVVGIWHDLHVLANRMAKKIIDQAERQKDVTFYRRSAADDAQEAMDAQDGDSIASDDPDGIKVVSYGGQQTSNENHLNSLMVWFNLLAANPQAMAGNRFDAGSATEATLMQTNANVGLEDMKDLVYQMAETEAGKRAWYFHTDPLISLPLTRRTQIPPVIANGEGGPMVLQPGRMEDQQIFLTPEARRGDWIDFTFSIQPESMGRRNSATRFAEALDFSVKVLPAVAAAAQTFALLGYPFNAKAYLIRMAKDRGMDWLDEVFMDPEFQFRLMLLMQQSPQAGASKGTVVPNGGMNSAGMSALGQILQNGQPASVMGNPSEATQQRQEQQAGAAAGQRMVAQGGF